MDRLCNQLGYSYHVGFYIALYPSIGIYKAKMGITFNNKLWVWS